MPYEASVARLRNISVFVWFETSILYPIYRLSHYIPDRLPSGGEHGLKNSSHNLKLLEHGIQNRMSENLGKKDGIRNFDLEVSHDTATAEKPIASKVETLLKKTEQQNGRSQRKSESRLKKKRLTPLVYSTG